MEDRKDERTGAGSTDEAGERVDVLVVGGGPAGLTAAIYLARFHLSVLVVDRGGSRAATIPLTRNHAGFPDGIAGQDLLERMRRQAMEQGARVEAGDVRRVGRSGDDFTARVGARTVTARTVLIATGVTNHRPDMDAASHDDAVARGLLRYCPICDGYEVTDRRVGVLGTSMRGYKEAIFLRGYTADLTLIAPDGPHELEPDQRAALDAAGVRLIDGPARAFLPHGDEMIVDTEAGRIALDSLYPALGSDIHSDLAEALGAVTQGDGCLAVDDHQRTVVPGLYAAGDVVLGLDQISHAMGEGGVAATTIRNDLAERAPLRRAPAGGGRG